MVRVQSIVRGLLVAAVAVSAAGVRGEDAETQTTADVAATCVAPEVVANFETKIDALETERAQWQRQLVSASGQWKQEKAAFEEQLAQEQAKQTQAEKEFARAKDEAAKAVVTLETQLGETVSQHAQVVEKLEKQLAEAESQHAETLSQLQDQVAALEQTVDELKKQVAEQKVTLGKRDAEVSETKAKLLKSQDKVKTLEHDVASSRKKNEALRDELQKLDEKLTVSALLSAYYDEGVVLASNAVTALRLQLESAQQGSTGVTQALEALEAYRKTAIETTDKLYAEHLAATVDPLIADLRRASDPYVKEYQPLVEAEFTKAKKAAIRNYNLALKRAKAVRADAITALKQTEGVAPYAQKIVDGSLYALTAPLVFVAVRVVLSLVWFLVRTAFCLATFGYCCGLCARKRSKSKRKVSRKQPLSPGASAASSAPSSSSAKKSAGSPTKPTAKRVTSKKHK